MSQEGRRLRDMDNPQYLQEMQAGHRASSGVSSPSATVLKYFCLLKQYTVSRFNWDCPRLAPREAARIEELLFYYGHCAVLYPKKLLKKGIRVRAPYLEVHQCAISEYDIRTGEALKITLSNVSRPIDVVYKKGEFVLITPQMAYSSLGGYNSVRSVFSLAAEHAYEFANKLYELDLVFSANVNKLRMPIIVNTARRRESKAGAAPYEMPVENVGQVMQILQTAALANEMFAEIPSNLIGQTGLLHETSTPASLTGDLVHEQRRLYDAYFELLGFSGIEERKGAYVDKESSNQNAAANGLVLASVFAPRKLAAKEIEYRLGCPCNVAVQPSTDYQERDNVQIQPVQTAETDGQR